MNKKPKKIRIEETKNGFIVVVSEGRDEFVGRWVFNKLDDVFVFISNAFKPEKTDESTG